MTRRITMISSNRGLGSVSVTRWIGTSAGLGSMPRFRDCDREAIAASISRCFHTTSLMRCTVGHFGFWPLPMPSAGLSTGSAADKTSANQPLEPKGRPERKLMRRLTSATTPAAVAAVVRPRAISDVTLPRLRQSFYDWSRPVCVRRRDYEVMPA
jgi:hypothetical protein